MEKRNVIYKLICGAVVVALAVLLLTGVLNRGGVYYHRTR